MKHIEILIVSDSKYELETLQQLLSPEYGHILQTTNENIAVRLFKEQHPALLILSYEQITKAEKFYMSLYEKDPEIYSAPHKTLLLCKGQESEEAYELCKNGIMNDYVADRPLFDPFRLKLSVKQAIKIHRNEHNSFWVSQQIDQISEDLKELYRFVMNKLRTVGGMQQDSADSFNHFTQKLSVDIKKLQSNISPLFTDTDEDNTEEVFNKEFSDFHENSISSASKEVSKEINKSGDTLEELAKSFQSYIDKLPVETETVKVTEVLVVDDDEMYCEMVAGMIESDAIHVTTVESGRAAFEYLRSTKPDVILLDYLMPVLDGIMVLKNIKSNPKLKSIPVIMLTGDSSRTVVSQSMKAGAIEFIIKPGDRNTLVEKIESAVDGNS